MAARAPAGSRSGAVTPRPWVLAGIGAIAGVASGLLGVGGGFVIVPLEVAWARMDPHRASGTSLAAILPIALVGAVRYYLGHGATEVDVPVALLLVAGSVVGAYVGARAIGRVPARALQMLMAATLGVVGVYEVAAVLLWPGLLAGVGHALHLDAPRSAAITGVGLVVGVLSGLTGVGGGVFMVPAMVLGFGLGQHLAQGTSLAAVLPTAAAGAVTHRRRGNVDVRAAAWIGGVGAPSALAGVSVALALPQQALVLLFGSFLVLAAARMWPRRRRGGSGEEPDRS